MKKRRWSILYCQMEKERGLDRAAAIADMRFGFIEKVCRQTVVKAEGEQGARSEVCKIDRLLTGNIYGDSCIYCNHGSLVFWLTFNVIGAVLSDLSGTWALAALTDLVQTSC